MKKKNIIFISIIVLLIVIIIVLLNIPDKLYYNDSLIMSLPDYKDNDCYFYGENKDYTDYCKFYFKKNIEESIKELEEMSIGQKLYDYQCRCTGW